MNWIRSAVLFFAVCFGLSSHAGELEFNRDIRPILGDKCLSCHGIDSAGRKAGLRLDTFVGATTDGAIVPGDPEASEAVIRMRSKDQDEIMPPPEAHKTMSSEEIATIAQWIREGAEYQEHWAFRKPERPVVPVDAGAGWAQNPIDHFIREHNQSEGLSQKDPAAKHILARRASFDLTGLPPEEDLFAEFMSDESPGAYHRYVDALLTSKHAGEHRARYWLDAARYGDTHGMHLDNYREMWPYRDWVINAFNRNMPFDEFVIEQIGGDLLPNRTIDQQIATGFNRCNVSTAEGGSIPEEVKVRYMIDRVETTATVFMGLTAGCSVCHDHKYDPISQQDFYSLGAFFNNTVEPAMDGNRKDSPPVVVLPGEEHKKEWQELMTRRAGLRSEIASSEINEARTWAKRGKDFKHPVRDDGLILHMPLSHDEERELPEGAEKATNHPHGDRGIRFAKRGFETEMPAIRSDEPFTLSFWIRTPNDVTSTAILDQQTTITDAKDPKKKKTFGWKLTSSTQGAVTFEIAGRDGRKINGLLPGDQALTPKKWQHVCVRYSGGQAKTSISILVNGEQGTPRPASQQYIGAEELSDAPLRIAPKLPTGGLSDIRIYKRWLSDDEVNLLADEFELKKLWSDKRRWNRLGPEEKALARRAVRNALDNKIVQKQRVLAASELRRDFIHARSVTSLVSEERMDQKPRAWVLNRGEYDKRGEEVIPAVPEVLPDLPAGSPRNRLGLAHWIVSPDNPLTARVTINRLWQSVFGTGLVKTAEDFGVMGDSPSHPELLDWLAVEFIESGWDINHMLKLLVTSATYQQSSAVTPDLVKKDPENRLLARGPRVRLDAEGLRDQALAVTGLLDRTIGGPSVNPYQPAGLWKVVAFAGSNTKEFKKDEGAKLYRRSVYTFWKRTSPPASMATFDAPTREQCTVRRERTNTPLQALVLMNDAQYVEAARHLARMSYKSRDDDASRVERMLESALFQPASEADRKDLLALLEDFRTYFGNEPDKAEKFLNTGDSPVDASINKVEFASWTMLANTVMNRDDFISKN